MGNYYTHVRAMHPEELAFSDFYNNTTSSSESSSSSSASSAFVPSVKGSASAKKQKLGHTIQGSFSNASAKAQRSFKQSLTDAIVDTIIHTPCSMYTVLNPATRDFVARLLQVEESTLKLPSYSTVVRAVHKKVNDENVDYIENVIKKLGYAYFFCFINHSFMSIRW
jgi:hypothetical protein